MKAMGFAEFGGPEVLVEMDVPLPVPAPGQITIDVAWAGVNFVEILLRQGKVPGMSAPFVPGLEVSGRVAALGEGVTEFAIGQPVMAFTHSGYAARIAVDGRLAAPLDRPGKAVGLRDAAGLPC
ncbi:MAG: alcohol dehydrogenase catalytic domain-containing protein, partial [Parvibaculum sp.]|nr:alcohol dehydrogenase catalytic domain-containing protein [Parvibaculum sp.]